MGRARVFAAGPRVLSPASTVGGLVPDQSTRGVSPRCTFRTALHDRSPRSHQPAVWAFGPSSFVRDLQLRLTLARGFRAAGPFGSASVPAVVRMWSGGRSFARWNADAVPIGTGTTIPPLLGTLGVPRRGRAGPRWGRAGPRWVGQVRGGVGQVRGGPVARTRRDAPQTGSATSMTPSTTRTG
jgi:hypothetical protein